MGETPCAPSIIARGKRKRKRNEIKRKKIGSSDIYMLNAYKRGFIDIYLMLWEVHLAVQFELDFVSANRMVLI